MPPLFNELKKTLLRIQPINCINIKIQLVNS